MGDTQDGDSPEPRCEYSQSPPHSAHENRHDDPPGASSKCKPIHDNSKLASSSSPRTLEALPFNGTAQYAKHPAMWGSMLNVIRSLVPNEPLHPGDLDVAESYAGTAKVIKKTQPDSELSSDLSSNIDEQSRSTIPVGRTMEDETPETATEARELEKLTRDCDENSDGLFRRDSGTIRARKIAGLALAAMKKQAKRSPLPFSSASTPSQSWKRNLEHDNDSPSEPSPKALRSPIWRSLVPMDPPPEGYWTPHATGDGEKNTPMCPPCRTGKKGRCYGGLPCDRCKAKGYSKERCEGSLVFRFSPRTNRGAAEREKAAKKSPTDNERWRRDAFGRFT